ncbi:TolC family protein (plasmid) [Sphaerotilus sulfidivorans]|uniref:TolC family protein n=2 Tax=Sphaerotilus sulfidivorans TaxID=639200 RepID=A0A5C1Q5F8_9BURK|nr:TolC family protein [Sphaerotilus sulfidivorans]NZD47538.1 TolC family protein [Sphaerotilus sulfidivorans]QEN02831.1 TolC family protein [Sphaerotilus sulfidivorans]
MFHPPWPHGARRVPVRCRLTALLILGAAWAPLASHAQPALTLDQALQLAQDRSRQLPAQEAAATAAREMAVAAGQRPDPTLKVGLGNLPLDGPDRLSLTRDSMTMRSVGLMQEITRGDKLAARSARFDREADAADAARVVALAHLRRDTAMAWLDRHFQERLRELLQSQRVEAGLQIEAADAAYRGGRGAQADVFAARSAAALIDDRLRLAAQQVEAATVRLARWVGPDAQQPLGERPPLTAVPAAVHDLDTHPDQHPEIALLMRQQAIAQADADLAQRSRRPDWNVELMLGQRGPAYSTMVSVGVSIPLQIDLRNRQDRELSARLALVEQARAQREDATREHLTETRLRFLAWQGNQARLAHYDRTLLPLAAERTQATLTAYRGGSGSLDAVLDARRLEIDTRIDRLRLDMETAGLWAQLHYLTPADPAERRAAAIPTTTDQ